MCNKTSTLAKEQNIANTSENPHVCHLIHSLFSKDIHYPNYVYDSLNTLLFSFAGFMDFCKRNITGCAPLCLISFTWYHVFWDTYMSSSVFVICPLSCYILFEYMNILQLTHSLLDKPCRESCIYLRTLIGHPNFIPC